MNRERRLLFPVLSPVEFAGDSLLLSHTPTPYPPVASFPRTRESMRLYPTPLSSPWIPAFAGKTQGLPVPTRAVMTQGLPVSLRGTSESMPAPTLSRRWGGWSGGGPHRFSMVYGWVVVGSAFVSPTLLGWAAVSFGGLRWGMMLVSLGLFVAAFGLWCAFETLCGVIFGLLCVWSWMLTKSYRMWYIVYRLDGVIFGLLRVASGLYCVSFRMCVAYHRLYGVYFCAVGCLKWTWISGSSFDGW